MKFKFTRFGLAENPRGAQVVMPYKGRSLLGNVIGCYRNETRGMTHLVVRYFNGERWPFDPGVLDVDIIG